MGAEKALSEIVNWSFDNKKSFYELENSYELSSFHENEIIGRWGLSH